MDLNRLRTQARVRRRVVPVAVRHRRDEARLHLLRRVLDALAPGPVAAYVADDGEPDPLPWRLVDAGRAVVLPIVAGDSMTFHLVESPDELTPGRWGIPVPSRRRPVDLRQCAAVLVPLVAFDLTGARIGRGRGYYDRALSSSRLDSAAPIAIGIADDAARRPWLPQHGGDQRLDLIVTEHATHRTEATS